MSIKIITIFFLTFLVIFGLLNISALTANISYGAQQIIGTQSAEAYFLPLSESKAPEALANSAKISIPKINISAPIIFDVDDKTTEIYKSLRNGVVLSPESPKPGTGGTAIILGHSSSYPWYRGSYDSVFALLNKLQAGDTFSIQYESGQILNYRIEGTTIFNPFNKSDVEKLTSSEGDNIVLVSCWPVGTSAKRIGVRATRI